MKNPLRILFGAIKLILKNVYYLISKTQQRKQDQNELAQFFLRQDAPSTDSAPLSEWDKNIQRFQNMILTQDPVSFITWDVIQHTMFVNEAGFIKYEYEYLRNRPDWGNRWQKWIVEDTFGCPIPSRHNWLSSDNIIHHAFHFARFEESTKKNVKSVKYIAEFGGGYGSMCRLAFRMGFEGKYVIFDLPAFSALQKYYLKSLKLEVADSLKEFQQMGKGILCVSNLDEFRQALPPSGQDALFLATWSLSESPVSVREKILPLVDEFDAYLIAYQDEFGQVDNLAFFSAWKNQKPKTWHGFPIEHLPGSYYLFTA